MVFRRNWKICIIPVSGKSFKSNTCMTLNTFPISFLSKLFELVGSLILTILSLRWSGFFSSLRFRSGWTAQLPFGKHIWQQCPSMGKGFVVIKFCIGHNHYLRYRLFSVARWERGFGDVLRPTELRGTHLHDHRIWCHLCGRDHPLLWTVCLG